MARRSVSRRPPLSSRRVRKLVGRARNGDAVACVAGTAVRLVCNRGVSTTRAELKSDRRVSHAECRVSHRRGRHRRSGQSASSCDSSRFDSSTTLHFVSPAARGSPGFPPLIGTNAVTLERMFQPADLVVPGSKDEHAPRGARNSRNSPYPRSAAGFRSLSWMASQNTYPSMLGPTLESASRVLPCKRGGG